LIGYIWLSVLVVSVNGTKGEEIVTGRTGEE
jgi:hypothetical protein